MNIIEFGEQLESSWDYDKGFFGKLRNGTFDETEYNNFLNLISNFSFDDIESIPKNIVSMLWYIPLFMEWQKDRIQKSINANEYALKKTNIENELERLLGCP